MKAPNHIPVLFLATVAIPASVDAEALLDLSALDVGSVVVAHATVSHEGKALAVRGVAEPAVATVQLDVPAARRDLSSRRFVEIDIENARDEPLRFTFWALSGNGWGGASTWTTRPEMAVAPTPGQPKALGHETLQAKERRAFRIDLHARYPGPDALTGAVNPACVRWLKLVLGDGRRVTAARVHRVTATGAAPATRQDTSKRIIVPDIARAEPAAGKRVYQQLPGWEGTKVEHVLTLPKEWKPGAKFPIIVEYTGNVFCDKWCHSTGLTEQGTMAYGLSRGETFILLNLPFVSADGLCEEPNGWGSLDKTEDYCLQALEFVSQRFGGDLAAVFFTGFSRGQIAMNTLALRDDRIAGVWRGFIGADPAIPAARKWPDGKGWNNAAFGWDERGARLRGRPFISVHPNYGPYVHVDVEYLEDSPATQATRAWLHDVLKRSSAAQFRPVPAGPQREER